MAGTTSNLLLPTYGAGDPPNGAAQESALAQAVDDRYGRLSFAVGATGTTVVGTNNFDSSNTISVAAASWPRMVLFFAYQTVTMSGSGASSPNFRVQDNFTTRAQQSFGNAPNGGGVGSLSGGFTLAAGVTAALKLNVDVPAGWSVTSYTGVGSLVVAVLGYRGAT